jgi:MFS family permease
VASSVLVIVALRLVLGAGEAIAYPASLAFVQRSFPEERRGFPTGVYLSGVMIGPAVGALAGAALLQASGWRVLFMLTGLGGCLWLLPWLVFAPTSKPARLNVEPAHQRTPWRALARHPSFWGITLGMFFYSYFWYFCLTWIPSYLVIRFHVAYLKMGIYTAVPLVGMALVSILAGKLADHRIAHHGTAVAIRRKFVCTGFVVGGAAIALLIAPSAEAVVGVLLVSLFGLGITSANLWALTQAISPRAIVGRVVGYQNTISNVAGLCAPIATGYLIGPTKNFSTAICVAGICPFLAALSYRLLIRGHSGAMFPGADGPLENAH